MNITLHLILIHFIYLYISICLYNSIRISLYFSTVFLRSTRRLALQFSLTVISSYGFLFSTVASLTVGSPVRPTHGWLYVFLYGPLDGWLYDFLYGYLYTVFFSLILHILYYLLFILLIDIHCILNTIFYYILYYAPP